MAHTSASDVLSCSDDRRSADCICKLSLGKHARFTCCMRRLHMPEARLDLSKARCRFSRPHRSAASSEQSSYPCPMLNARMHMKPNGLTGLGQRASSAKDWAQGIHRTTVSCLPRSRMCCALQSMSLPAAQSASASQCMADVMRK